MNGRKLLLGIGLIIAIHAVAKNSSAIEVTDFCTAETGAIDNTVCVQSAIDQAASMGGGRVHFAPGKYLFKLTPFGRTHCS